MSRPSPFHQVQYHSSYSPYNRELGSPVVQPASPPRPQLRPSDIAEANHTAQHGGRQSRASFPPSDRGGDVWREIVIIRGALLRLERARSDFTAETNLDEIVKNVRDDQALKDHLLKLEIKQNALILRGSGRKSFLLDPVVLDKLLELQRDTATKVAALTLLGASLSLTLMYSAARGNMWYPFVAWYMFGGSMVATTSLALATSGFTMFSADDPQASLPTQAITTTGLFLRVLSAGATVLSLATCGCGWAILSAGTATYNVRSELHGKPAALWGGPEFSTSEFGKIFRVLIYLSIAILCLIPGGCYFLRLTSRLWSSKQEHLVQMH